jgi:hypothetical protein
MKLDWAIRMQEKLASRLILKGEGGSVGLFPLPSAREKTGFLRGI